MKAYLKRGLLVVLFMGLACMVSASGSKKDKEKKEDDGMISGKAIRGMLSVSTNENGAAEAYIDAKAGFRYNIVLSALIQNISNLKSMNGMEVLAKGEIRDVDGKKWLTVAGLIVKVDASNTPPDKSKKK